MTVISNASCTTNCLAPMAKVLHEQFRHPARLHGDDPRLHRRPEHRSIRCTRTCTAPAPPRCPRSRPRTGAARAVGLVLPELKGKLDGTAIRIPTPNVSLVSLDVNLTKHGDQGRDQRGDAGRRRRASCKGILDYNTAPLVSIDFNHCPASCTFDATQTAVVDGALARVMGWYDNEWGFSNRMSDTAALFGSSVDQAMAFRTLDGAGRRAASACCCAPT